MVPSLLALLCTAVSSSCWCQFSSGPYFYRLCETSGAGRPSREVYVSGIASPPSTFPPAFSMFRLRSARHWLVTWSRLFASPPTFLVRKSSSSRVARRPPLRPPLYFEPPFSVAFPQTPGHPFPAATHFFFDVRGGWSFSSQGGHRAGIYSGAFRVSDSPVFSTVLFSDVGVLPPLACEDLFAVDVNLFSCLGDEYFRRHPFRCTFFPDIPFRRVSSTPKPALFFRVLTPSDTPFLRAILRGRLPPLLSIARVPAFSGRFDFFSRRVFRAALHYFHVLLLTTFFRSLLFLLPLPL